MKHPFAGGLLLAMLIALVAVLSVASPRVACADTPAAGATNGGGACGGMDAFKEALKRQESGGRAGICNDAIPASQGGGSFNGLTSGPRGRDCCGFYQICGAERANLGFGDRQRYLTDPAYQEAAYDAYRASAIRTLQNNGSWAHIGETIGGVQITDTALIGAAHIAGPGRVDAWLSCGGCAAQDRCDSNGTCLSTYLRQFSQYGGTDGSTDCSGSGAAGAANQGPLCDPNIRSQVEAQVNATTAKVNDFITTTYTPPPTLSQISNSPCASKELTRITNQFAYAPSRYAQQLTGQLISAGGPISGIMQNLFKAEFSSISSAAASIPSMLNFQSMASNVLGSLMSSLGLGGAFSSEMCGLMVDMLLKYIQCENPIKLPSLGNLFGSLNNLIPNNCAGSALKSTLYAAGNMSSLKTLNQPLRANANGSISMGTAPAQ